MHLADQIVCRPPRRQLLLTFRNGTTRTYKNNWNKKACEQGPYESCKLYALYDYFPEHELFIVLVNAIYFESNEWLLVRQLNGKEEKLVAPPRYSPNKKWLASVYWTEGTDDGNNGRKAGVWQMDRPKTSIR